MSSSEETTTSTLGSSGDGMPGEGSPGESSKAMRVLKELVDAKVISDEQYAFLSQKFTSLNAALVETMDNDRKLLSKAKKLNKQLTDDKTRLDSLTDHGDATSHIELLREDVDHAEQEAAVCAEREQLLQVEIGELNSKRDDLRSLIEDAHAQYSEELEPQVRQLREEIATLREENNETEKRRRNTENERNDLKVERDRLVQQKDNTENEEPKPAHRWQGPRDRALGEEGADKATAPT